MSENRIPLFPLGLVLLPGMPLPLHIFEERYKRMIEMTSAAERLRVCAAALGRIIERARLTQQLKQIIGGNGHPPGEVIRTLATGEEER